MSTITNAKNGTTRTVYDVESVSTLEIDPDNLSALSAQDKIIIEGLQQAYEFEEGEIGTQKLCEFVQRFCYLADYKHKKTHATGRVKKTDTVETAKRVAFKAKLPENRAEYVVDESFDGWSVVKGEVGTVYFDGRVQKADGKGAIRYYYTFEDACRAAAENDCGSITLNESGYSLRIGQIPIKVGIKKGSKETAVSHPERQIMSWAKDSSIPLPHSRIEPVNDKRKATKFEAANMMAELKYLRTGVKPVEVKKPTEPVVEKKAEKPKKKKKLNVNRAPEPAPAPEPEPEPEPEEEDSDDEDAELDVEEIVIDGKSYFWEETTNTVYGIDSTEKVGYLNQAQDGITTENELE
tara:strand:- start:2804 stop:3856 length:1053 start_codon:yes stop_codon:yes gene_type:complete